MSAEDALDKLKSHIRSLLVSSKLGLNPLQLRRDYETMLGQPMPLKELGFRSVMDMAREMPDVVSVHHRPDGTTYFTAVCDESTREIADLVAKQRLTKSYKKIKNPGYQFSLSSSYKATPQAPPRRGRAPPALPAQLRAQLRILLSQGPVRLSDLQSCYCRCFGHPLNIHNYGFYSTGEMLEAVADLVCIQQSRFGSVLVLTEHLRHSQNWKPSGKPSTGPKTSGLSPTIKAFSRVPDSQVIVPTKPAAPVQQSPPPSKTPAEPAHSSSVVADEAEVEGRVDQTQPVPSLTTFEKRVLKLEEELRQQIIENSVSGVVSQDLKDKLLKARHFKVVSQANGELSVHDLPAHYKKLFDEELPLLENGFVSVTELVGVLTDIFLVKPANDDDKNHLVVMDVNNVDNKQPGVYKHDSCNFHINGVQHSDLKTTHGNNTSEMYPPIQVHHSPAVPLDALLDQRLKPPTRCAVRQLVEVLVEAVESPGLFYIRFIETEEARALGAMMIEMKRYYTCPNVSKQYQLPAPFIRQGQVCCVLTKSSWFYRVVIHRVINPTQAEVYFVDFGNILVVQSASLKFLKSIYSVLPAQAVPASLSRIKPISGTWTDEAIHSFRTWCLERFLVGALDCYTQDVLQLFLCDTSTNEDVYVHELLLSQGHGTVCSPAASQALCVKVTPVSLYLGKGMVDLPEIKTEEISSPKSAEESPHSLDVDQKVEEDELPDLEVIELNEKIQVEVKSSLSTPSSRDSNSGDPALQDVQQSKVTDSPLVQPPLIWRMLGLNTSILNKSPDAPAATLNLRRSGSCFPLFGGGSL
ncbi:Tudor domain-containing protein 5 [Oryzias melastigma]|uniref:Tudor domain-containing protein 5 n=1 Tax=Oryzias melastigma TaxID=30732 RepID=A0A834KWW5_ORYME|nr:Tudor domain-containing protein 5 [Oryzias melastigma]